MRARSKIGRTSKIMARGTHTVSAPYATERVKRRFPFTASNRRWDLRDGHRGDIQLVD